MEIAIGLIDQAILLIYLLGVAGLGIWVGRGARDLNAYFLGGRHLPWWAVAGSIVATETSTATFLSVPGIAFAATGDFRFLQITLGYLVGRSLVVWILLPLYFRGEIYTAYKVLEERFGGPTKRLASVIFLGTRNLGDGLRLYLTAIALEQVAGLPLAACIVLIGIVTIAYTLLGGMKAVVWNDCIQFLVYMVGGIVAGWVILSGLPEGWDSYVEFGQQRDKFRLLDFRFDPTDAYCFWSMVVGGLFLTLGTHGTDQMMVQRYLCARTRRDAGWALVTSSVVVMLQFALFLAIGVGLAAFYASHRAGTEFDTSDYVFATFIVNEMPHNVGLIGIVLAAVFSAAMSTLSSSINSSAASAVNDLWYATSQPEGAYDSAKLRISKLLTVLFGIVQILVAVAAQFVVQSVVTGALAVAGFAAGLLLGVFALGVLTRHVGQVAAAIGLAVGLLALILVAFVLPSERLMNGAATYSITWPWYPVVGSVVTFATGLLAQACFGPAGVTSSENQFDEDDYVE